MYWQRSVTVARLLVTRKTRVQIRVSPIFFFYFFPSLSWKIKSKLNFAVNSSISTWLPFIGRQVHHCHRGTSVDYCEQVQKDVIIEQKSTFKSHLWHKLSNSFLKKDLSEFLIITQGVQARFGYVNWLHDNSIFLVKSKLSTAILLVTTTFSRIFLPWKIAIFSCQIIVVNSYFACNRNIFTIFFLP